MISRAFWLLLLLALAVSLVGMLMGGLRMLFCGIGMLHALRMIPLAVMLGGRTVRLGGILVVLSRLVVLVSSHFVLLGVSLPAFGETSQMNNRSRIASSINKGPVRRDASFFQLWRAGRRQQWPNANAIAYSLIIYRSII